MAKTFSVVLVGVESHVIEIEALVASGFSGLHILGIGGDVLRDLRERVRSALESVDFVLPARRIVVNLTPSSSLKLSRTPLEELDFAVAAAVIRAIDAERNPDEKSPRMEISEYFLGELSLTGELRPLSKPSPVESLVGRLPSAAVLFIPGSANTAAISPPIIPMTGFAQWCASRSEVLPVAEAAGGGGVINGCASDAERGVVERVERVLAFYPQASRALVTLLAAAAGRHNLLLAGEPGVGKSFLAQRLMELQPPLSTRERGEVALIQASEFSSESRDPDERPFRAPHHTATSAALIGGASLRPGEVTLAHRGLLFLDELAEFGRGSLEALREPLDNGKVVLSRAVGVVEFPASFQLCAATNPCPCGFLLSRRRSCRCSPTVVRKYHLKLSGPILDRFALQVWLGEEGDEGVFVGMLERMLRSEGEGFVARHFLKVRDRLYHLNDAARIAQLSSRNPPPLNITVSKRGEKHLRALALTFCELFPDLEFTSETWSELARYRMLERKLGEALSYS